MIRRYEKYKDSGVEWIGEIPEGWEVKKVKYLTENLDGKRIPLNSSERSLMQGEYPYYGANGIVDYVHNYIFDGSYVLVGEDGAPFFIFGNDVAFHVVGKFWVNNHAHILRALKDNPVILTHLFNSVDYKNYISGSTRDKLTQDQLNSIELIEIPPHDQIAIASFLDHKTAKVDQLITIKGKLVALYEEEKTTIINHAVTKGLDPKVKTSPSGVNWLGDIPEHWEVKRLKYFTSKVGSGVTPKGGANVYQLDGVPLLRSQNVHFSGLKMDDVAYITQETHDDMGNSKVMPGDVLLNITGASIGRCYFADETFVEANVNQHVCIIRPTTSMTTRFLYYLLRSDIGQKQIDIEQTGSGREGLNFESLKNFVLPVPEYAEQTVIVTHIEAECSRLDTIIDKLKKQIELFKEYRTTLISEVVTGKIDVRDEVAA